jgi:hypothetical protein
MAKGGTAVLLELSQRASIGGGLPSAVEMLSLKSHVLASGSPRAYAVHRELTSFLQLSAVGSSGTELSPAPASADPVVAKQLHRRRVYALLGDLRAALASSAPAVSTPKKVCH